MRSKKKKLFAYLTYAESKDIAYVAKIEQDLKNASVQTYKAVSPSGCIAYKIAGSREQVNSSEVIRLTYNTAMTFLFKEWEEL